MSGARLQLALFDNARLLRVYCFSNTGEPAFDELQVVKHHV